MLDCYTLSLLSLSLTLSIIIIIIIIIISTINIILEEKEKAAGWEGGFTNKTVWTCLYACYLYNNFSFLFVCLFVFWSFSCKKFYYCVCKFDEKKNSHLLKRKITFLITSTPLQIIKVRIITIKTNQWH